MCLEERVRLRTAGSTAISNDDGRFGKGLCHENQFCRLGYYYDYIVILFIIFAFLLCCVCD